MRLHQSWYRHAVLGVPFGTGPRKTSKTHYGNMLDSLAADAGCNFLTPEIYELAKARAAEGRGAVEPFRLFRNMLSSQPMCINLFGFLATKYELLDAREKRKCASSGLMVPTILELGQGRRPAPGSRY